jgi:serine-type D-Ala-D-Ala carboxypeptidase (penicillin-binding protein 5/6)
MLLRVGAVLLLILAVAATVNYLRPIPAASAQALLPPTDVVPGTPPTLPWPAHGSGALAVSGLGMIATSGNEQAIPAASVTKVMTALVLLEDKPLKKGENGPIITLSDVDVQFYKDDLAGNQSTVPVQAGEQLTELQALEGMLIPSANNLAETLARWDTGSIPSFVAKMNAHATSLHLTHTRFTDVSGASDGSVSTPSDLVALGMAALNAQDVITQIVSMGQVQLPVAGTVFNVDAVLGQSGIFGIKTGSGLNTGANFLFAANVSADGHTLVLYGCVMGQPSLDAAFTAAKTLITAASAALHVRRVITRNQSIATYVTAWGEQTDLVSTVDVDLAEWPGMIVRQRLSASSIVIDQPIAPGTREGTEHLVLADYSLDVPLVTADQLYPPGRFWRLTRISL